MEREKKRKKYMHDEIFIQIIKLLYLSEYVKETSVITLKINDLFRVMSSRIFKLLGVMYSILNSIINIIELTIRFPFLQCATSIQLQTECR
uniref:Uncharacterized protein n=1 Tax=Octopus bimaculoides TaxID=37653 RepID=A0A0L8G2D0_OCTBM